MKIIMEIPVDEVPEIKELLQRLINPGSQKQNITLKLDNGKDLSGFIRSEADDVRIKANDRNAMARRRLYN
jgi:hypothetical protein